MAVRRTIQRNQPFSSRSVFGIRILSEDEVRQLDTDAIENLLDEVMDKLPVLRRQITKQEQEVEGISRFRNQQTLTSREYIETISRLNQLRSEQLVLQGFHSRLATNLIELRKQSEKVA